MPLQPREVNSNRLTPAVWALVGLGLAACGRAQGNEIVMVQSAYCGDLAPRVLAVDSFAAYVEAPQIVRSDGGTFLLGWPAFAATAAGAVYHVPGTRDSSFISGARLGAKGSVAFLPELTAGSLANPRAVVDPVGRVHVLWVEGDSRNNNALPDRPITWSQWQGTRWSKPDSVRGTAGLGIWRPNSVSPPVTVGSTMFLVATFGVAASATRAITWQAGKWVAQPMPQFEQSYLSFAAAGDTVVAVHLGYGAPDGNAVYAKRSTNGGKTFLAAARISPPATGQATDMRVLRVSSGRYVAVWIAERRSDADLFVAYSDDGGATWQSAPRFQSGTGILAMRAATTTTGKVAVIAQLGTFRRVVPTYLEWRNGEWSKPIPLINDDSSSSLGVASIAGGDSVIMAWGEYAPRARRPVTKYVVFPATCRVD